MSEHKNIVLTGATGFLGSHLAYQLLRKGHRVTALARGTKSSSPQERVAKALRRVALTKNNLNSKFDNLEVLEGDIGQPDFGLSDDNWRKLASSAQEVWHCAASLSFAEEERSEIFRMNVDGTRNVLKLVEQLPIRRLHHVSTAYVAGTRTNTALETEVDVGQTFKNPYEESKCRAELLVHEAYRKGLARPSVYRPSIVIGDSTTGQTTHFHGVYAFIRGLWSTVQKLRRGSPREQVFYLPLRLLGAESTTLNFVPIDYVVAGMIEISQSASSIGTIYHLANPNPTENHVWLRATCRALRVEGIQLVGKSSFIKTPMTKTEVLFQKQMAFYYMYLQGEPRFDCHNTLEALKHSGVACPQVTADFIEKMAGWYLDFLSSKGGVSLTDASVK